MKRYLVFTLNDEYYYGGFQDFDQDFDNFQSALGYGVNGIKRNYWSEFQIFDRELKTNNVYSFKRGKIINWSEEI